MAVADMFLKVEGVTGEAADADHEGEIEVVSWSWGMHGVRSGHGGAQGSRGFTTLDVVKRVDRSTTALMTFLWQNADFSAQLTVRKAGQIPFEYLIISMTHARVVTLNVVSENTELVERIQLGFSEVTVAYTEQGDDGGPGGGTSEAEFAAYEAP